MGGADGGRALARRQGGLWRCVCGVGLGQLGGCLTKAKRLHIACMRQIVHCICLSDLTYLTPLQHRRTQVIVASFYPDRHRYPPRYLDKYLSSRQCTTTAVCSIPLNPCALHLKHPDMNLHVYPHCHSAHSPHFRHRHSPRTPADGLSQQQTPIHS